MDKRFQYQSGADTYTTFSWERLDTEILDISRHKA